MDRALQALTTAARLDVRNAKLVQDLANLCLRLGRYSDALSHFRRLTELLLTRWEPQLALAKVSLQLGLPDEADIALSSGLRLAPDEPKLLAVAQRLSELRDQ